MARTAASGSSATKRSKHFTPTPYGTRASIRIAGQLYQKHFPRGTDPVLMRQWLVETEMAHRGAEHSPSGAFDRDAARYLKSVSAMPSYPDRARQIQLWVDVFKSKPRRSISSAEIAAQLHEWRKTLAASTVNQRRTALMHLWSRLDGKSARNPVKDTPRFSEPQPAPRHLDYATIRRILGHVPRGPEKARLMVIAYVGLPNAIIAALRPEDFDATRATLAVEGRRKGAGGRGRVLPLSPSGVRALRLMAAERAWGPFSRWTLRRTLHAACDAAGVTRIRPYDLRHAFGTEVYRRSGDIRATQVLMLHSTPTLTHRYTLGAVEPRIAAALKGFGR